MTDFLGGLAQLGAAGLNAAAANKEQERELRRRAILDAMQGAQVQSALETNALNREATRAEMGRARSPEEMARINLQLALDEQAGREAAWRARGEYIAANRAKSGLAPPGAPTTPTGPPQVQPTALPAHLQELAQVPMTYEDLRTPPQALNLSPQVPTAPLSLEWTPNLAFQGALQPSQTPNLQRPEWLGQYTQPMAGPPTTTPAPLPGGLANMNRPGNYQQPGAFDPGYTMQQDEWGQWYQQPGPYPSSTEKAQSTADLQLKNQQITNLVTQHESDVLTLDGLRQTQAPTIAVTLAELAVSASAAAITKVQQAAVLGSPDLTAAALAELAQRIPAAQQAVAQAKAGTAAAGVDLTNSQAVARWQAEHPGEVYTPPPTVTIQGMTRETLETQRYVADARAAAAGRTMPRPLGAPKPVTPGAANAAFKQWGDIATDAIQFPMKTPLALVYENLAAVRGQMGAQGNSPEWDASLLRRWYMIIDAYARKRPNNYFQFLQSHGTPEDVAAFSQWYGGQPGGGAAPLALPAEEPQAGNLDPQGFGYPGE